MTGSIPQEITSGNTAEDELIAALNS